MSNKTVNITLTALGIMAVSAVVALASGNPNMRTLDADGLAIKHGCIQSSAMPAAKREAYCHCFANSFVNQGGASDMADLTMVRNGYTKFGTEATIHYNISRKADRAATVCKALS